MVIAYVETVAEVKDFAVVCIVLLLQLQPSQFLYYSNVVLYILVVSFVVTPFYITNARLTEDCGVYGSPRLRTHDRRTDFYPCHTSSLEH